MLSKKRRDFSRTLTFRLALSYTGVFILSTASAFIVCYLLVASHLEGLTDKILLDEFREFIELYDEGGMDAIRGELALEVETEDPHLTYFRMISENGEVIDGTDTSSWDGLLPDKKSIAKLKGEKDYAFGTLKLDSKPSEVRYLYGKINHNLIFDFGLVPVDDAEFLYVFRRILIFTGVFMSIASLLVGWIMARRALAGVEDVTLTAIEIQKGGMDKRVPLKSRGLEIETLAIAFNEMIDHVQTLMREMRELTDNIAHDLRSPITAIRGRCEMALTSGGSENELAEAASAAVADCDGLLHMINGMLDLAEADAGVFRLAPERLNVLDLIGNVVEMFETWAEEKNISVQIEAPEDLTVAADRQALKRIMANLLDNAIKYSPPGGRVAISARGAQGRVEISVADTGPGIGELDRELIFKRFYRLDKSRSKRGAGIGLALSRALVRAQGGEISLKSEPGQGSVFTFHLPERD